MFLHLTFLSVSTTELPTLIALSKIALFFLWQAQVFLHTIRLIQSESIDSNYKMDQSDII